MSNDDGKQGKRGGIRRGVRGTEREMRRMLRAAKPRGKSESSENGPDETLELVPMADNEPSVPPNPWEDGEDDAA